MMPISKDTAMKVARLDDLTRVQRGSMSWHAFEAKWNKRRGMIDMGEEFAGLVKLWSQKPTDWRGMSAGAIRSFIEPLVASLPPPADPRTDEAKDIARAVRRWRDEALIDYATGTLFLAGPTGEIHGQGPVHHINMLCNAFKSRYQIEWINAIQLTLDLPKLVDLKQAKMEAEKIKAAYLHLQNEAARVGLEPPILGKTKEGQLFIAPVDSMSVYTVAAAKLTVTLYDFQKQHHFPFTAFVEDALVIDGTLEERRSALQVYRTTMMYPNSRLATTAAADHQRAFGRDCQIYHPLREPTPCGDF